ncbi:aminoacetone oxidase family FAD-binding enzyme [Candidatus Kaiserbacteria bacterium]|nr:aminoacetone oxidase family FAD-binding enzyme [Candidatus Kaiserbacteria bacterium]
MKASSEGDTWDVAVIGGGPAGMMAAGRAAELGARVVLLEKNPTPGKKLLITGGGRCNVTNAEPDVRKMLAKYKSGGKFLASPFSLWNAQSTVDFFEKRGVAIKVEAEQRAFPVSDSARSIYDALVSRLKETGVTVMTDSAVKSLDAEDGMIADAKLRSGARIRARTFILATGGVSRPETGSTGDGFAMLRALGHTVDESGGALVPIVLKKSPLVRAAGVALKEAKLTVLQDDIKQDVQTGKLLFTHVGLSGPLALNASRTVGELLVHGPVSLEIDLMPDAGYEKIDALLQEHIRTNANKMIRNSFGTLLPPALVPALLETSGIQPEKLSNSVTRTERIRLMKTLKHLRVEVERLLGLDKAVVTSGGLSLTEVDFKTMRSMKYTNLFVTGDILDIERPSGGYSLQICWTTGFVAGSSAAALTKESHSR